MKPTTLTRKFTICLLAGLVCGETFLRVADRFLTIVIPPPVVMTLSVLILVGSLAFPFFWNRLEQRNTFTNTRIMAFWIALIRYGIAFDLSMFGFQKIFHLQFISPLAMIDEPFSSLSSQWLTWSYFGHSYGFAFVIGVSQIMGSMLLVFNRTRLIGLIVIMPILLNIIFIDYFYELDFGVLVHAIILWLGVLYLLLLDYDRLVQFFLRHTSIEMSLSVQSSVLKTGGRLSILFVPLVLIAFNPSPNQHPWLRGKYSVVDLKVNGRSPIKEDCRDSVLTLVYFDLANESVFEFNGQHRRMFGKYTLTDDRMMNVTWHFPEAAKRRQADVQLEQLDGDHVQLKGVIGVDTIDVTLKKYLQGPGSD